MKIQKIVFSLILLLTIFLVACSPKAAPTEVMKEKEMTSAEASEKDESMMEDKSDEAMVDKDDEMMSENNDQMMSDEDNQMMEDKEGEMSDQSDNAMMEDKSDEAMSEKDDEMMSENNDQMMSEEDDSMVEDAIMVPEWFNATLTNAHTGETFTISDFKGKVVLVETLAMWCSNCFKQQGQVQALHDLIGERDDFVSLGVDIDPNENAAALQAYTDKNGFDWLYTVASTDVAREIGQLYGDQFLNPPSTPMLIIDRHGEVHPLPFGIKSTESLLEALQPFLDGEM